MMPRMELRCVCFATTLGLEYYIEIAEEGSTPAFNTGKSRVKHFRAFMMDMPRDYFMTILKDIVEDYQLDTLGIL